jgi:hypothetical protein
MPEFGMDAGVARLFRHVLRCKVHTLCRPTLGTFIPVTSMLCRPTLGTLIPHARRGSPTPPLCPTVGLLSQPRAASDALMERYRFHSDGALFYVTFSVVDWLPNIVSPGPPGRSLHELLPSPEGLANQCLRDDADGLARDSLPRGFSGTGEGASRDGLAQVRRPPAGSPGPARVYPIIFHLQNLLSLSRLFPYDSSVVP